MLMREVYRILKVRGYEVLMVDAHLGDNFGMMTSAYLNKLLEKKGRSVMLAVCTHDYAEITSSQYSSNKELTFAHENRIPIWPLRVDDIYPPEPPKNHFDPDGAAAGLVQLALPPSLLYEDCRFKSADQIADVLGARLRHPSAVRLPSTVCVPAAPVGLEAAVDGVYGQWVSCKTCGKKKANLKIQSSSG